MPVISTLARASTSTRSSSSTPSSRPVQQPLAATLPPELLELIFKAADELSNPNHALPDSGEYVNILRGLQRQRIRLSLVCRSWFFARIKRNEYEVYDKRQAVELLKTFACSPARGSRTLSLEVRGLCTTDLWAPLAAMCPKAVDVALDSSGDVTHDALCSLPATLKTLNLKLDLRHPLPTFHFVPAETKISLALSTFDTDPSADLKRALEAVSPVLGQISRFTSCGDYEDQPVIDEFITTLTSLKVLRANRYHHCNPSFPALIAQLGSLETLELADDVEQFALDETDTFAPDMLRDIIEHAPPTLTKIIECAGWLGTYGGNEHLWGPAVKAELKQFATSRGIKLEFVNWAEQ